MKTIKQVSKLSGASVRTLQYYDNIHLLTPSQRTASGYRLYSDDDITKLQQILFLKALGFPLKEIRRFINDPNLDQSSAFRKQKELLYAQRQQAGQVIRVLERLENGASLADCAADIKLIKEPKAMKKSIKLSLLIIPIILAAGVFGIYQITHHHDNPEPTTSPSVIGDVVHINPVVADSAVKCYALDIVDISATDFPEDSPSIEQIALPEDFRDNIRLEAFYPYTHNADDQIINYSIKTSNSPRYVYIGFSPDHTPIREMYVPEGKPSIINGREVMIGRYMGETYIEERDILEPVEKYYIDFVVNGMNYSLETHGLSEAEVVTLIRSLL